MGKIADISKWQGTIDWSKASKDLDLVIIRVQYGSLTIDSKYKEYVAGAKQYNIPFGHYAYAQYVSVNDAKQEAKDFWSRADKNAEFYVIDVEEVTTYYASDLVPATQAFIDYLHSQGATKVGLYSGDSFYKEHNLSKVKADFLWIARYGVNNGSPSTKPSVACDLWQYTSAGSVSGISGNVDLNKLNGKKTLDYFTGISSDEDSSDNTDVESDTPNGDPDANSSGDDTSSNDDSNGEGNSSNSDDNDTEDQTDPDDNPDNLEPSTPEETTTEPSYDTEFINPNNLITNYIVNARDKVAKPQIFLATPNRVIIGKIAEADNKQIKFNITTPNELSLSIPYMIDIDGQLTRNPIVDRLKERFLIKVSLAGIEAWYIITKKEPSSDENGDWLNISCYSQEYELNYKKVINYQQTSYNCLQVLTDCLKNTNWKIGYINDDFNLKYKSFDVSSTSKLDFINQICDAFNAYAIYDTVNKKVNICKEDEVSVYKGFWIEYGKYLQSIDQTIDIDDVVTRLNVEGSGTVSINSVNPTGQSYINDFSYFLYPFNRDENRNVLSHSYYMSDELCHAILDYNELVNKNENVFQNLLDTRSQLQSDLLTMETDLSTLKNDLQIILDDYSIAVQNNMPTDDIITQRDEKQAEVNSKQSEIDAQNALIKKNDTDISNLNTLLSFENNFSDDLLAELQDYIFEDEFSDDNQTTDADLYDAAVTQLGKVSIPPINISVNIINFFSVLEEKDNWNRLAIGDIIRIKQDKLGIDVKAKVDSLSVDFENNTIGITVTNAQKTNTTLQKWQNALYTINKVDTDYNKRKINWNSMLTNFNLRNDRISATPTDPVLDSNAVSHKLNDNGSVDLSLTWTYPDYNTTQKDEDNIDGFIVYMFPNNSNEKYIFGSQNANENYVPISSDKRTYTFPSVPSNKWYTLGIKAYRVVDDDINSDGYLFSNIITPSGSGQNPYLPSETVVVNGALNGKVNGATHIVSDTEPSTDDLEVNSTVWVDTTTKQTKILTNNGFETTSAGDATTVSGYTTDINNTGNTIPIRDAEGTINASITGNASSVGGRKPGIANGLATLDSNGFVYANQLGNASKFAMGTYTGDATQNKLINVGFSPSLVKIYTTNNSDISLFIPSLSGGFSFGTNNTLSSTLSTSYGKLDTNGFYTGSSADTYGNKSGVVYYWEAFKM